MSILPYLATSLGKRDEVPNIELAKRIADKKDKIAVKELIENLSNKSKDIQHDCIKVLYETGERNPSLIIPYFNIFLALLTHKNNRLQWGAMIALSSITGEIPDKIYESLPIIVDAADKGSVITRDYFVNILLQFCAIKKYAADAFSLLNEQLLAAPTNQLPMYAEKTLPYINEKNRKQFVNTLTSRLNDIEKDTKRKRVEKVIKKLNAK